MKKTLIPTLWIPTLCGKNGGSGSIGGGSGDIVADGITKMEEDDE